MWSLYHLVYIANTASLTWWTNWRRVFADPLASHTIAVNFARSTHIGTAQILCLPLSLRSSFFIIGARLMRVTCNGSHVRGLEPYPVSDRRHHFRQGRYAFRSTYSFTGIALLFRLVVINLRHYRDFASKSRLEVRSQAQDMSNSLLFASFFWYDSDASKLLLSTTCHVYVLKGQCPCINIVHYLTSSEQWPLRRISTPLCSTLQTRMWV